jgi:hypothetical protein
MPSHTELRDELERLVIADLLGPANGSDEIVGCRHRVCMQRLAACRRHPDRRPCRLARRSKVRNVRPSAQLA